MKFGHLVQGPTSPLRWLLTTQDTPTTLGGRDGRTVGSEDICCGMPAKSTKVETSSQTRKGSQPTKYLARPLFWSVLKALFWRENRYHLGSRYVYLLLIWVVTMFQNALTWIQFHVTNFSLRSYHLGKNRLSIAVTLSWATFNKTLTWHEPWNPDWFRIKDPYFMIFMAYEMLLISLGSITPYRANN